MAALILTISATASEGSDVYTSEEIFSVLQRSWADVINVSYESFSESVLESDRTLKPFTKLRYSASGSMYEYKLETKKITGELMNYQVAFDGALKQIFVSQLGLLSIKTLKENDPDTYVEPLNPFNNELFQPFIPFPMEIKDGKRVLTRLSHLNDERMWNDLKQRTEIIKTTTLNGFECIEADIQGSLFNRPEVKSFTVYFSLKNQFYPIAWIAKDATENHVLEYYVTQLAEVESSSNKQGKKVKLSYPQKSKQLLFEKGTLFSTAYKEIKTINLNTMENDDKDVYTIDPAIAKVISDMDTMTNITIPK